MIGDYIIDQIRGAVVEDLVGFARQANEMILRSQPLLITFGID
jgi:hypothetical protein